MLENHPPLLNKEVVETIANNADKLKGILRSEDESNSFPQSKCCCPRVIKFKFILCNVTIDNENAECID